MAEDDDETRRIRSAALKNVEGILIARQSAERELLLAKDALERRTVELAEQRAWFEVTLASIGDAVITTDTDQRVTSLNSVAETMTGWSAAEARGQPLTTVFRIVNEDTQAPVANPIAEVLSSGRVVGLANHTALVARDGASIAIEDSAAPIKGANGEILGAVMVFHDVTERRAAERARQASEERLRAVFQQVPVGIAVVALDTRIIEVNQRFLDILGYTHDEIVGMNFTQITHPDDLELTRTFVAGLAEGHGTGYSLEKRYIRKDGAVVWSRTAVEILHDDQGRPHQYVGSIEDITERRTAAKVIEESAQRLQLALAAGDLSDWSWDAATDELTMGPTLRALFGLPEGTRVFANQLRDFLIIDQPEVQRADVQKALASRTPFALDYQVVRPDSPMRWLSARGQGVYAVDGSLTGLIGVVQEVTEEREAATDLRRFAAVVQSSDDAIISKNLSSTIQSWNRAAERMFGYTAAEAIGQSVTMLIPEGHQDEEPTILERLRRGEHIDHYETVRRRKDGSLVDVSLSVSPIRDSSGRVTGASKIVRDITRQKADEQALRDIDRRKDEFLATLAHELRNPLAPIRQAAMISKMPTATEAQKRWSHDVITRQVHNMALLLDDLLDISRITRGTLDLRRQMTDLRAVVDAAVETARPTIDAKHHALSIEVPSEFPPFEADALRLAQVLSNLLTNAAKYTDPGGRIRLTAKRAADTIVISVSDSGIGLPRESLLEVFNMFSQVKSGPDRSEGGLGIGLALARGLVELHGGTIEAKSAGIGQGSEFIVRLPVQEHADAPDAEAPPATVRPSVRRRILVADDNRDGAESLALLLGMEGHDVKVVHDGTEALAAFASFQPEVALLDIGMPGLSGYDVARQVRQGSLGRAVTLIAVTGWGQDTDRAQAVAAGFDHHFTKPLEPEKLTALLRLDSPPSRKS